MSPFAWKEGMDSSYAKPIILLKIPFVCCSFLILYFELTHIYTSSFLCSSVWCRKTFFIFLIGSRKSRYTVSWFVQLIWFVDLLNWSSQLICSNEIADPLKSLIYDLEESVSHRNIGCIALSMFGKIWLSIWSELGISINLFLSI